MQTVAETPTITNQVESLFDEAGKQELITYLEVHPLEGDVISGTGGVRKLAKLTQPQMAFLTGMSISGYRKWEQGERNISGPAATHLRIMEKEPEAVRRALV